MKNAVISVLVMFTLVGCGKPLPSDKLAYAGQWQSAEMRLHIEENGMVSYQRIQGGSTSVNGPLKKFEGDDFIVGITFFETTFEVSQPPLMVDGKWTMVVDGITLVKANKPV